MADDDFKMPTDLKECPHKTEFPPMTAWDHYVSVKVGKGEQKKEFNVYRGLLTYYSSYFAAALDGNFKEGVTQVVELKEDDPKVFEAFRSWMYTRRLLDQVPSFDVLKSAAHDRFLCNVFIFGDMRGIPGLKNEAIDQLHRSTAETWMVPSNDIKYIYTHTPVPSSLRDFVVSVHALTKNSVEEAESGKHGFTVDFLFDLLKMVNTQHGIKNIGRLPWARLDRCQWHDHSGPGGKLRAISANGSNSLTERILTPLAQLPL